MAPKDRKGARPPHNPAPPESARPTEPDNVIALSRFRADLGRARRQRRADAVLNQPRPEEAIRALPGDEFYYLLRDQDLRESTEILAHASADQIQTAMDLSLWSKNQLSPDRVGEWTEAIAELPPPTLLAWARGLDTELVALLIRKGARIYDLTLEEAPDEPEGTFYPTPDGFFLLDVVGYEGGRDGDPEVTGAALTRLIDKLYRADLNFMRRLLVGARSELDSELEETALRWRQGRLADRGFADPTEALEVYRELDPTTVRIGEKQPGQRMRANEPGRVETLSAPGALLERLGLPSLFTRAIGRVTSADELAELQFELVALTNRVLSADGAEPGDDDAVAATVRRVQATIDLALEFLARNPDGSVDEDRAVEAVRTVSLVRMFRVGVSLAGKVRALARTLTRRGPFAALPHLDLIEEPEHAVFEALRRRHPMFARAIENPPSTGERPFGSLADIAVATAAVQRAAAAQAMLQRLGVEANRLTPDMLEGVQPDARAIDTGVLARTALVLLLQGGSDSGAAPSRAQSGAVFRPLTSGELRSFPGHTSATLPELMAARARQLLTGAAPATMPAAAGAIQPAAAVIADRWLASLAPLEAVLVRREA